MTALPPYSGPLSSCQKCGNGQADTQWQPSTAELSAYGHLLDRRALADTGEPGWLLRTCTRCGYQWAEATQDASVGA